MIAEFSIVPLGEGPSVGDYIAEVISIVEESGLPYRLNPMGTCVEGSWNDIMKLLRRCHRQMMKRADRVIINIKIDDRKDKELTMEGKVKSVERRLGRKIKKG
ncbi:MAG: thiamine-binding protein [Nitrospirae bacterium]|nr:MAG: thiamine-binding protein [Nitrospirota bacterium]